MILVAVVPLCLCTNYLYVMPFCWMMIIGRKVFFQSLSGTGKDAKPFWIIGINDGTIQFISP